MPEPATPPPHPAVPLLQQGQSLEEQGRFDEALGAYDAGIALLRSTAASDPVGTGRMLGVAWINRGNALQRLATAVSVGDAVRAYDEAIATLEKLPLAEDPASRNHLGAAWMNRGHALLATGGSGLESFERAVQELSQLPIDAEPFFRLNLAGAWTNVAQATLPSAPERARSAACASYDLVAPMQRSHEAFADLSLRARHLWVTAILGLLALPASQRDATAALVAEATDVIEEALAFTRELESHGVAQFRALAFHLFRHGAQFYGAHQPQFLGEFVMEQLAAPAYAADPEFRRLAEAAITQTLARVQGPRFFVADTTEGQRLVDTARSLREAQEAMAKLPPLPPRDASARM